ncbi:hypothetical protein HPB50_011335 [Hyalomma asiaticum]|uniref:Uncharacterized protein n=1 Tax=Hyalomma asiaticum TaxID=266040 RepID=A0ACB7RLP0_HYAAI|nr:hypothetical protein HPB50_011335 [Hyalomma asiaticum]
MESSRIDADVEAFIQKGLEGYGHIDTEGSYAWLTSLIMTYGVELTYENLITSDSDFQANNFQNNGAMLGKILSAGPPVRKLRIGAIRIADFKAAFETQAMCSSLKEVHLVHVSCPGAPLRLNDYAAFKNLCKLHLGAFLTGAARAEDMARYMAQNKCLRELTLGTSCWGDEGIALLLEALKVNDTLKIFYLCDKALTYDNLISFAKMLASNSTLEVVGLDYKCTEDEDKLPFYSDQELPGSVFNRLDIEWPWPHPRLTALIRKHGCAPRLQVSVRSLARNEDIQQFFEALARVRTLRELHLYEIDRRRDAYTDGIAYLLKRSASLREILIWSLEDWYTEHSFINIVDALKKNRSVTTFEIEAEELTPRVATSLSELLAVNSTLNDLAIFFFDDSLSSAQVQTIEKAFEMNYTLTKLYLGHDEDEDEMGRIGEYMRRNITLENKAAMCVISGVDLSDETGMDALKKVHSGTSLAAKVQMITGKTREEALDDIQRAVARLHV